MEPPSDTASPASISEVKMSRKPERTRPLKTYSKRSQSAPAEPPAKKRRIDGFTHNARQTELPPPRSSPQQKDTSLSQQPSLLAPSQPTGNPKKKGTILGYFKVVSPSSNTKSSSSIEPSSCTVDPPSTPPSSPPSRASSRSRKRRRLMTRVIPPDLDTDRSEEEASSADTPDRETDNTHHPSGKAAAGTGILEGASPNDLNQAAAAPSDPRSEAGKRGKRKSARTKANPNTVQTTLSLSLSSDASGFAECRDCNMLYNPYHEKDARLHARRHAALLSAKAKAKARTKARGEAGDDEPDTCDLAR